MKARIFLLICLIIIATTGCAPDQDPDLSAWFEQPADGAQLPQLPINLQIVGQANLGIDSFDLYINGQLEDSFPPQQTGSTSGGPTKFFSEYLWSPSGTGTFVLGVRAHDGNGGVSPTTQISIEIQPPTVQGPPFVGDVAEINPDSPLIGTPVYPSFILNSAQLVSCEDLDFLKVEVRNNGPFYFQWVNFHVWYADGPINFNNWEDPWVFDGSACPVPAAGSPSLAPGSSAFIYFPITPIFPYNDFLVNLQMCTYADFPDSCPEETVEFVEDLWHIVKLKEVALCWVGPGPDYEVVNSIAEGRSVELLGKGDVEGFLVVQEPKYKRPCWLLEESAEKIPDEVEQELTTFETPRLPDGVVSGKVFKDQDGNGEFGGSDVGFSGAKVALAPGMCSNPGQAMTITTNNNGRYSFDTVAPGQYCLYVPKPSNCQNFSTADGYDISVGWGSVIEVNFGLLACR